MSAASKKQWEQWLSQLRSQEPLDRCDAAEAPPQDLDDQQVVNALIPLLDDEHYLVRLAAAETLGLYPGTTTLLALREYVGRESDSLARAYGLSSLGRVGNVEDFGLLVGTVADPEPSIERVHAMLGLFELARNVALRRLEKYMTTGSDEVRVSAGGALAMIVKSPQRAEVVEALRRQMKKETPVNSQSYFERFLRSVNSSDDES